MAVATGNIFRVVVHWAMPEQVDANNVLGLICASGSCTDAELLTAVAAWLTTAFGYLQGAMHNQVDLADARVVQVVWSGAEWITNRVLGTVMPTFAATDANDMLPHAVSPHVTFNTLAPTRKGKVKLTGFSEVQQADSILLAGAATAMGNFASALLTPLSPGSASCNYVVLGDDGQARNSTGALVRGIVGSQRQRRPGVGI